MRQRARALGLALAAVAAAPLWATTSGADGDAGVIYLPGPRAAYYDTTEAPAGDDDLHLARTVAARWPSITWSDRLARAAAAYAAATVQLSTTEIDPTFLQQVIAWSGCPESTAAVLTVANSEDSLTDLLVEVDRLAADVAPTHLGAARVRLAGGPLRWRWAVVATVRAIAFAAPLPSRVATGDAVALRFRLAPGHERPRVVLLDPDAHLVDIPTTPSADNWYQASWMAPTADGVWRLQITAATASGPRVVTQLPILVGAAADPHLAWRPTPLRTAPDPDEAQATEHAMVELVNDDRQRAGLPPLAADQRLAAVARAHCRDMVEHGFLGHQSPTAGGLGARLAAAAYPSLAARENVAAASSLDAARAALWESPSHRANLLAVDVTHLGVGVVLRPADSQLVVTQIFARPLLQPTLVGLVAAVASRTDQARASRGLPRHQRDAALDRAAERLAGAAAATGRLDRDALARELATLAASGRPVADLSAELRVLSSLEVLDDLDLADEPRPRVVGFGGAATTAADGSTVFTVVALATAGGG